MGTKHVQKWWFFPITGITLTDSELDLTKSLWTLHVIIRNADLERMLSSGQVPNGEAIRMFVGQQGFFNHHYYLGVRVAVPLDATKEQAAEIALLKAEEFMAVLMFYAFSLTSRATCGLEHRIANQDFGWMSLEKESLSPDASFSLRCPVAFPTTHSVITCSSDELAENIKKSAINQIGTIVFADKGKHFHDSFIDVVKAAVRALSNAMYADSGGECMARTVTMLEILLKQNQDKDDTVKRRAALLTGPRSKEIDHLYSLRNSWVHEGLQVPADIARNAISFGIQCLISYCHFIEHGPKQMSRSIFLSWLDLQTAVLFHPNRERLNEICQHFNDINVVTRTKGASNDR